MNIKTKPDKEIRQKCEKMLENDNYYIGPHKVTINLCETEASISWSQGGLIPMCHDTITVKKHPFTFFGLKTVKPYEERIQYAADIIQRRCDEYDALEIENYELVIE